MTPACATGAILLTNMRQWRISVPVKIVRTKRYTKDLKRIGASAADVSALETAIASDPTVGDVVPGLRGIRKVRFGVGGKGKRGGGRAIYFLMIADDAAVMLSAYAKSEKADLTAADKKILLALVKEFENG